MCGYTLIIVNFHLWKCTRKCVYPLCGFTQILVYYRMRRYTVNVNSHMRKSVFPRTRICTVLSELPHVEIHKSMCKSAPAKIRFSPCGNSHEIVHFRMWKYTKNCGFPNVRKYSFLGVFPHAEIQAGKWIFACACQFTSGFMNFRGEKRAGIHDFSWISTCGNTRGNVNSRVWKYTRKCVLPHAVIH